MTGKWIVGAIVAAAALAGGGLYYLQIYHFYERLDPATVRITLTDQVSGGPQPLAVSGLQAIDANSSPIRFRACFEADMRREDLVADFAPYPTPEPLNAPEWFSCFDAQEIGAQLEDGRAVAVMGHENLTFGIDLVVAFTEDGRGFAWRQINHCGEKVFDGEALPEGCPPVPVE